ncbi:sortase [Bifidobacterium saguini DSM 23967]|uniref:Sortase n=1 Tax=Bifidobacterium saguini DSM 23967 TaxID=1437607 RepID=A0A087D6V5_9BIFI|nr:class C sortase [Bifidobacterium saguini]KFI91255.1 sortase [Bifidobacterium saguini DSM 23967]
MTTMMMEGWADLIVRPARMQAAHDMLLRRLHRRYRLTALAAILCLILGSLLTMAPYLIQMWGQREVEAHARAVTETASMFPEASRESAVEQAVAWNRRLYESGQPIIGEPVFDGKTAGGFQGDAEYQRQLSVNGLDAMGELLIPVIGVDMPIMHGAGQQVLEHAAGHLPGTSLPVGGNNTRTVITGHSNLKTATLFTRLGELKPDDRFYIRVMGHTLAYRVTSKQVIRPDQTRALRIRKNRDMATLLTCTGAGNTMRLIVNGIRDDDPSHMDPGMEPRDRLNAMITGITAGLTILAVGIPLAVRREPTGMHIGYQRKGNQ